MEDKGQIKCHFFKKEIQYKLFEEFPQTIQSTSEITITGTTPNLTNQTTITPKTINTQTLKLETLQNGKITITINTVNSEKVNNL